MPHGHQADRAVQGPARLGWLNADQKRLYARMMEVFAGYGAQVDARAWAGWSTR